METQNTPPAQQTSPIPPPPTPPAQNTGMAILSYLGILVIIPLLVAKDDPYVKFHIKQGLVLLIAEIVISFFSMVPIIGWIFGGLLWLGLIVLIIMGIVNAAGGKQTELPLIGKMAEHFHF